MTSDDLPFRHIADALWDRISDQKVFGEPSRHLAHYTSATGALDILNSGALWATDTNSFDPSHAEDHRDQFARVAVEYHRNAGPRPSRAFRKALLGQFNEPTLPVQVFATCLSVDTDSPRLWQRYGGVGRGAALVVDTHRVNPAPAIIATPCIYDSTKQRDLLFLLLECCDTIATGCTHEEGGQLISSATSLITLVLQAYKRLDFMSECECRYSYIDNRLLAHIPLSSPLGFPDRRVIPIAAPGKPHPFAALKLGPLHSTAEDIASMRGRLRSGPYASLPVVPSSISPSEFRSFVESQP